jgi:hypothetical protein
MQHGKEPSFRASLDWRGPSIGADRSRMPSKIEDVHRAFLYRLALKCLADGNGLGERRGTTVHALNSDFQNCESRLP